MNNESRTQALYAHARQVIPGGTQLLSKRPEMFARGLPRITGKPAGARYGTWTVGTITT